MTAPREDDAARTESVLAALRRALVDAGRLDDAGWARADAACRRTGERVDRVLIKLGLAPEPEVARALAQALGLGLAAPEDYPEAAVDLGRVSAEFLRAHEIAPLDTRDGVLRVATADPFDTFAIRALERALGRPVAALVGAASDIRAALARRDALLAEGAARGTSPARARADAPAEDDVERLRDLASEAPIVRLVNELIDAAAAAGASDIHLEPDVAGLRVRLRVDGALRDHATLGAAEARAAISRVKIMARLDIAERRLPQDGRLKTTSRGREIDLRVSTLPAIHGEAVALRVLDPSAQRLRLDELGLPAPELERLRALARRPSGLLIVTGPTGGGKTTTLYAAINEVATPEAKVLTVEDPIEYRLARAVQVQVKPEIGLGFAQALRAFLRHDPDIVMVGEVRDRDTAEIAAQAALTGHLVFTTLHTNSAVGAVDRLRTMGVAPDVLGAALSGLVAQRLLRRLCAACRAPIEPPAALIAEAVAAGLDVSGATPHRAVGCPVCAGVGYRGRRAAIEVIAVDDGLRAALHRGASALEIEAEARACGARGLRANALALALAGETSLAEVARAAGER